LVVIILDAGPIVALLNRRDAGHRWVVDVLPEDPSPAVRDLRGGGGALTRRTRGSGAASTKSQFPVTKLDFRAKGLRAASTKLQFRTTKLDLRAKKLQAASTKLRFRAT
jgi:hypothetical protein